MSDTPSTLRTSDRLAAKLRGFGPLGIIAALLVFVVSMILGPLRPIPVLAWAYLSRTPWREIGLVRPASWIRTIAVGIGFGCAFKFLMKAIVMPLLGAPAINPVYHYLAGNTGALPGMLFMVIVGAGFGEEILFRGFFFERLGKLLGSGVGAKIAIVLLNAALFGAIHYPEQGLAGAEQAAIGGLVWGTIFAATGQLWILIFAHAAFDVTAILMIYWSLESRVAHLVFK